jgi:cell division protein FtsL
MRLALISIAVLVGALAAACTVHETRTLAVAADDACSA